MGIRVPSQTISLPPRCAEVSAPKARIQAHAAPPTRPTAVQDRLSRDVFEPAGPRTIARHAQRPEHPEHHKHHGHPEYNKHHGRHCPPGLGGSTVILYEDHGFKKDGPECPNG